MFANNKGKTTSTTNPPRAPRSTTTAMTMTMKRGVSGRPVRPRSSTKGNSATNSTGGTSSGSSSGATTPLLLGHSFTPPPVIKKKRYGRNHHHRRNPSGGSDTCTTLTDSLTDPSSYSPRSGSDHSRQSSKDRYYRGLGGGGGGGFRTSSSSSSSHGDAGGVETLHIEDSRDIHFVWDSIADGRGGGIGGSSCCVSSSSSSSRAAFAPVNPPHHGFGAGPVDLDSGSGPVDVDSFCPAWGKDSEPEQPSSPRLKQRRRRQQQRQQHQQQQQQQQQKLSLEDVTQRRQQRLQRSKQGHDEEDHSIHRSFYEKEAFSFEKETFSFEKETGKRDGRFFDSHNEFSEPEQASQPRLKHRHGQSRQGDFVVASDENNNSNKASNRGNQDSSCSVSYASCSVTSTVSRRSRGSGPVDVDTVHSDDTSEGDGESIREQQGSGDDAEEWDRSPRFVEDCTDGYGVVSVDDEDDFVIDETDYWQCMMGYEVGFEPEMFDDWDKVQAMDSFSARRKFSDQFIPPLICEDEEEQQQQQQQQPLSTIPDQSHNSHSVGSSSKSYWRTPSLSKGSRCSKTSSSNGSSKSKGNKSPTRKKKSWF